MDKNAVIKMFSGTVARGILWAAGGICQALGVTFVQADNEAWAQGAAVFLLGTAMEVAAAWWSKRKDKKLLAAEPPK